LAQGTHRGGRFLCTHNMGVVKLVKNNAYFKRFQTKQRRRREGKTDYFARRNMVRVEKNKYAAVKHRLIARFTNKRCIAQIAYSTIAGDRVIMHADSTELAQYGVKVGLKNYSAAYCTGLLLARRVLEKVGLADKFKGTTKVDGEMYDEMDEFVEKETEGARPFKAVLDVGLKPTTTGSKVFGVLKGAADGGLYVPHSEKRFPGYKRPEGKGDKGEYDADFHKQRIFGGHVGEYMDSLEEEDKQEYEKIFATYIKNGIDSDNMEKMYTDCHKAIRAKPTATKKVRDVKNVRKGNQIHVDGKMYINRVRLGHKDRKARVKQRLMAHAAKLAREDEE